MKIEHNTYIASTVRRLRKAAPLLLPRLEYLPFLINFMQGNLGVQRYPLLMSYRRLCFCTSVYKYKYSAKIINYYYILHMHWYIQIILHFHVCDFLLRFIYVNLYLILQHIEILYGQPSFNRHLSWAVVMLCDYMNVQSRVFNLHCM